MGERNPESLEANLGHLSLPTSREVYLPGRDRGGPERRGSGPSEEVIEEPESVGEVRPMDPIK